MKHFLIITILFWSPVIHAQKTATSPEGVDLPCAGIKVWLGMSRHDFERALAGHDFMRLPAADESLQPYPEQYYNKTEEKFCNVWFTGNHLTYAETKLENT